MLKVELCNRRKSSTIKIMTLELLCYCSFIFILVFFFIITEYKHPIARVFSTLSHCACVFACLLPSLFIEYIYLVKWVKKTQRVKGRAGKSKSTERSIASFIFRYRTPWFTTTIALQCFVCVCVYLFHSFYGFHSLLCKYPDRHTFFAMAEKKKIPSK